MHIEQETAKARIYFQENRISSKTRRLGKFSGAEEQRRQSNIYIYVPEYQMIRGAFDYI